MNKKKVILITVVLFLLSFVTVFPFYIMITMGTKSTEELFRGISLIPGTHLLENIKTIASGTFLRFYLNSLAVSFSAMGIGALTSSMAGFALSKYDFKYRKIIMNIIVFSMMIPGQISLIAYIMEMRTFGLLDTLWPLIIQFSANAFGVYWMKQSMDGGIPDEVMESARIDGASEPRIFFSIAMPFVKAPLVTILLLLFLWSWNNYLMPLIAINDPNMYTVPLGLAMLNGLHKTNYAAKILALSFGTIPLVVLFIAGSKYFINGLTAGAVKG